MIRLITKTRVVSLAFVFALAAGGLAAVAAASTQGTASGYRTAIAEYRTIAETLDEVGTIGPVTHAEVAFPAAGTVASVEVRPGDSVTSGQVLATLDPASLEAAIREAQAALDQAELTLERALDGEVVGMGANSGFATAGMNDTSATSQGMGTGTGTSNGASMSTGTSAATIGTTAQLISTSNPSADQELRAAQQAVLDAQAQVNVDLMAAQEALESAQQICSALGESADQPDDSTTTTTSDSSPSDIGLCYEMLGAALDAQTALQVSQDALNAAVSHYSSLVAERAGELPTDSSPPTTTPGGTSAPPDNSSGAPSSGGAPGSGSPSTGETPSASTPSSERLIAYQAAIDGAAADLVVAEAALRQATIVSPVDGTVVRVDIAAGDQVSAASDTATISIDGGRGFEVTAIVGVDDLPDLEIGQAATITPDGSDTSFNGEVVSIGLTSSSDDAGSTYPVTISINGDVDGLRHGSVASVAIVLASGDDVLAVPTSAVRADDGGHSVSVLTNATAEDVSVEVGAIGPAWTEIRSGLDAGDVVVLADLDAPLPGSATEGGSGAGGGQPGGGGFGGGFRGPPGN